MTLDERMSISEPEPTGRPLFYQSLMQPARVENDRHMDVTSAVATRDLAAAPPGEADLRFIGRLGGDHVLTLSFAEPYQAAA